MTYIIIYSDIVENNVQLYKDYLYQFLSGKKQKDYLKEHPVSVMDIKKINL